ncbi:ferredoxin [Frankia sp. CcI49]|uniref:ferredoxin n=1 Tax=unclassified Frankia TaxID=2632575 RepID=UPI0006CA25FC|nr:MULTISPECIES: ferredoxin [unclassified Frankia]KPM53580.1 ferredoxin [Frankia sp. R43]ONH52066.1 ferredoxin [Frankia sp. CcI49]
MIASVDPERCAGHGACVSTCPEVFTFTDDGYAEVAVDRIPDELAELARRAAYECPERAVLVESP